MSSSPLLTFKDLVFFTRQVLDEMESQKNALETVLSAVEYVYREESEDEDGYEVYEIEEGEDEDEEDENEEDEEDENEDDDEGDGEEKKEETFTGVNPNPVIFKIDLSPPASTHPSRSNSPDPYSLQSVLTQPSSSEDEEEEEEEEIIEQLSYVENKRDIANKKAKEDYDKKVNELVIEIGEGLESMKLLSTGKLKILKMMLTQVKESAHDEQIMKALSSVTFMQEMIAFFYELSGEELKMLDNSRSAQIFRECEECQKLLETTIEDQEEMKGLWEKKRKEFEANGGVWIDNTSIVDFEASFSDSVDALNWNNPSTHNSKNLEFKYNVDAFLRTNDLLVRNTMACIDVNVEKNRICSSLEAITQIPIKNGECSKTIQECLRFYWPL